MTDVLHAEAPCLTAAETPAERDARRLRGATPAMRQYLETKAQFPEFLLFYRMGDFYELFFEDAATASAVLGVTLTKRGAAGGEEIIMCGVPHHSCAPYFHKLIKSGLKAAVCEQLETPEEAKKRGYKAVVRREVVRLVTAGTLTEDELLEGGESNYLAAYAEHKGRGALAWADISTGELAFAPASADALPHEMARLSAGELLLSDALLKRDDVKEYAGGFRGQISPRPDNLFDPARGKERLLALLRCSALEAFGEFAPEELSALGALAEYILLTQKGAPPRFSAPRRRTPGMTLQMDRVALESLDVLRCARTGARKGSLLEVMDNAVSRAGSRLLSAWLRAPLTDPALIERRQDAVSFLLERKDIRAAIRAELKAMPDMERALGRLSLGRGGPKDLAALREGAKRAGALWKAPAGAAEAVPALNGCLRALSSEEVRAKGALLQAALAEETPASAAEGGFVAAGYDARLDDLRDKARNGGAAVERLRDRLRLSTGVKALKINSNNVIGLHIDVPAQHGDALAAAGFVRRQTLANSARFTCPELQTLEEELNSAEALASEVELRVFGELREACLAAAEAFAACAEAASVIDVFAAFAENAAVRGYCRPKMDESEAFRVTGGRHPVAETFAGASGFVANDCDLSNGARVLLVTGPNMAGKSTFLRQNALILLMAHTGSFVPAAQAHIGAADRIFSRVGAADNPAEGHSTFMVEMAETAAVLHGATSKSFVVMDEIGRGTSTYDGVAIARAVLEHVADATRCRALCATHYHELAKLEDERPESVACYRMEVKEWHGEVIFTRKAVKGRADRSFGVHVARLAGLPGSVIERAYAVLQGLAQGGGGARAQSGGNGCSVSSRLAEATARLAAELAAADPDRMSPREAHETLYRLTALAREALTAGDEAIKQSDDRR